MLDLGVGLLDLALWMLDWPTPLRVTASTNSLDSRSVEDSGCAFIHCDGGAVIVVDVSWHYVGESERFWFEVMGSEGSGSLGPAAIFKELHGSPMNVTPTGATERKNVFTSAYASQWAHFAAMVQGTVAGPDLQEQVTVQRVLDAVYRSAADGGQVTVE